ncbi:Cell cycle checkpoint protein RAD1 [Rhynchospora pubera]|uniref:Cell cycle checkpoint protein RAD1 n=1 Tax=Rhynchospora pubera TaxID=906938 RepID=A0AAV8EVD3_9POAL|nr:Cell cycle checkpoint protein RAD1 [Rhynchospora pubera]
MSTSTGGGGGDDDDDSPDLVCQLDCIQGMVDALSSVRWKRHQDAVIELSEHGIVLIVEESGCLQAKVYLKRELFISYNYGAEGRPRFGLSLGLLVDCLNIFSAPGNASVIEIQYPCPDMQLLLKSVGSPDSCLYAEIRTRIPDTISWDYHFEQAGNVPPTFTVKSAILKEAIDDLDWPGSSIQIIMQPDPPMVTFRGEGHGDLQIEFPYYANTDLLIAFQCDRHISSRYKYKFLRATTSNFPSSVLKENRSSKVTIGRGGMLKIQHLVSVAKPAALNHYADVQPSRIAYIEFFVKPEEDETHSYD